MKKTMVLLSVLFTCHRLYAPIAISASFNAPVISGGNVIVSGYANPAESTFWTLEQSPSLSPPRWTAAPQQPVFNGSSFSCANSLMTGQLFYQMEHFQVIAESRALAPRLP